MFLVKVFLTNEEDDFKKVFCEHFLSQETEVSEFGTMEDAQEVAKSVVRSQDLRSSYWLDCAQDHDLPVRAVKAEIVELVTIATVTP